MNKACYWLRKDIQCLVWLYDTPSKLASGNLSKYLKFMPSLVTSVKGIHAAIPIIPIISTWWKMGSKGTLIRETSGKNTWIGGHWKMWPPVSCLFVLHSPLSHSSHRVKSKTITASAISNSSCFTYDMGVFRKAFHICEKYPSFILIWAHSQMSISTILRSEMLTLMVAGSAMFLSRSRRSRVRRGKLSHKPTTTRSMSLKQGNYISLTVQILSNHLSTLLLKNILENIFDVLLLVHLHLSIS